MQEQQVQKLNPIMGTNVDRMRKCSLPFKLQFSRFLL